MRPLEGGHYIRFMDALNQAIDRGDIPEWAEENPQLIGQTAFLYLGPCVYLLHAQERGSDICYLKVGVAKKLNKRLATIKTALPLAMEFANYVCTGTCGVAYRLEKEIHNSLDKHRCQGEWFQFDGRAAADEAVASAKAEADVLLGTSANMFRFEIGMESLASFTGQSGFLEALWHKSAPCGVAPLIKQQLGY